MSLYAIGDIHGQLDMLNEALELIERDGGVDAPIVFLGDYTDRGPDSRGVIDRLIEGAEAGRPWTLIKGNHDRMFTQFVRSGRIDDPAIKSGKSWLHHRLGGGMTLRSYMDVPDFDPNTALEALDVYDLEAAKPLFEAARQAVPEQHIYFLENLPLTHRHNDLLFVHAGINPKLALEWQDPEDFLWIREGWLDYNGSLPWLVVHGHTALDAPQHHGNRVNLDGGAGYGRPLVPAVFECRDCWLLTDKGRVSLSE